MGRHRGEGGCGRGCRWSGVGGMVGGGGRGVDVAVGDGSTGRNSTRVSVLALSSTSKRAFIPNGSMIYLAGVKAVNSTTSGPNSVGFWPVLAVLITCARVDRRTG